jgi:Co/Zn/Cd efflux system component
LLTAFAAGVVADAVHRFMAGSEPIGSMMMVMALTAAVVNLICLKLLQRLKSQDVNMRAAETFNLNDFVSNGGLLVAGALVAWTGQAWPDLRVGVAVAAIAAKGSFDILRDVRGPA